MGIVSSILKSGWKAVVGSSFDTVESETLRNEKPRLLPLSFIKESPGSLGENIRPVWLKNVDKENIPDAGIPCRIGLGFEQALLTRDAIIYNDRLANSSRSKLWEPT